MGLDQWLSVVASVDTNKLSPIIPSLDVFSYQFDFILEDTCDYYSKEKLHNLLGGSFTHSPLKFDEQIFYEKFSIKPGQYSFHFETPDAYKCVLSNGQHIIIPTDSYFNMCNEDSYGEEGQFYICQMREAKYWRKEYELQEYLYSLYPIENCGHHVLQDEDIQTFKDAGWIDEIPEKDEDELWIYHEWY